MQDGRAVIGKEEWVLDTADCDRLVLTQDVTISFKSKSINIYS